MSRKKQNIQKTTALYCRLSLEDGRENNNKRINTILSELQKKTYKAGTIEQRYHVGKHPLKQEYQDMLQ